MSLCRHLLLRVNHTNWRASTIVSRRHISTTKPSRDSAPGSHDGPQPALPRVIAEPSTSTPTRPILRLSPEVMHVASRNKRRDIPPELATVLPAVPVERAVLSLRWKEQIDAYEAARAGGPQALAGFTVAMLSAVATYASRARLGVVVDHLAADVLDSFPSRPDARSQFAAHVLTHGSPVLSGDKILSLLAALEQLKGLSLLSEAVTIYITKRLMEDSSITDEKLRILTIIFDRSLRNRATLHYIGTPRPSGLIPLAYFMVHNLLESGQDQQAYALFQLLVSRGCIPPEALQHSTTSSDASLVIISALARSCLHWRFNQSAVFFSKRLLCRDMQHIPDEVIELNLDVAYGLLETPTTGDVLQCAHLLIEIDLHARDHRLPDSIIRRLYHAAHALDKGRPAELLYAHTQAPAFLARGYPAPDGRALTWLMRHLAVVSCNKHLGRQLARRVVDDFVPVPLQDRAAFVALAAHSGYALAARALWERFAAGKHGAAVVGNARTMLRMVSCFANVVRTRKGAPAGARVEWQDVRDAPDHDAKDEEAVAAQAQEEEAIADAEAFTQHVLDAFRTAKEPLAHASHEELTSLARAHFILGDIPAGFAAFRELLQRKEVPDMHDINVALSALAEYTPRGAAQMVEQMVQRGIRPDAVTVGTVLHHAALHGDDTLVQTLVARSRALGLGQLDVNSVQALIRASVDGGGAEAAHNLRRAYDIVRALARGPGRRAVSPNTGKDCAVAALRAEQPLLAFKFWKLLVVGRTAWYEHQGLRRQIQQQLVQRGEMQAGMLRDLTKEPRYGRK